MLVHQSNDLTNAEALGTANFTVSSRDSIPCFRGEFAGEATYFLKVLQWSYRVSSASNDIQG